MGHTDLAENSANENCLIVKKYRGYPLIFIKIFTENGGWKVINTVICHKYGEYKYSRPDNLDTAVVFESWMDNDSRLTNGRIRIHIGTRCIV